VALGFVSEVFLPFFVFFPLGFVAGFLFSSFLFLAPLKKYVFLHYVKNPAEKAEPKERFFGVN